MGYTDRLEGLVEMNIPSINPQLRKNYKENGSGKSETWDYVFIIRPDTDEKIVDVDCYINEDWNQEETMKSMSLENAREWWENLVTNGYVRITTP